MGKKKRKKKIKKTRESEVRRAVILLHALEEGKKLGLVDEGLDVDEKIREMGLDPDKARERLPDFYQFLEESGGLDGRYPSRKPESTLSPETKTKATMAIRDYIFANPGCVDTSGPRSYYGSGYKRFILSILGPGGIADGATAVEAEKITGLSAATISSFRRQAREGKLDDNP